MVFKKITSIILVIMTLLSLITFSSCSQKDNSNAEIQVWSYRYMSTPNANDTYAQDSKGVINSIKVFCQINNIPLKVYEYNAREMTYEDYKLKRNLSSSKGNLIIIEDARKIWDISEQHADYTKLKNYGKLMEVYKNRFCIPLGVHHRAEVIKRDILDYYGIELDKSFITYSEYLGIKQELKEKGAEFNLHSWERNQLSDYFMDKYGLRFVNNDSEVLNNKDKFRAALKSAITEMRQDIIDHSNDSLKAEKRLGIFDKKSGLDLSHPSGRGFSVTNYFGLKWIFESTPSDIVYIVPPTFFNIYSPCFYMHKNITNSRIYELADFIVSENSNRLINTKENHPYAPVFKSEAVKGIFDLDENYKYNGSYKALQKYASEKEKEIYTEMCKYFDEVFDAILIDDETSKNIADQYFVNQEYAQRIKTFVESNVEYFIMHKLDYKDEKENEKLDKRIDEFVSNFFIHFK